MSATSLLPESLGLNENVVHLSGGTQQAMGEGPQFFSKPERLTNG